MDKHFQLKFPPGNDEALAKHHSRKHPAKAKGGKEVQRGRTQVRARKDLGKQPYVLYAQTFKNLRFSSLTR